MGKWNKVGLVFKFEAIILPVLLLSRAAVESLLPKSYFISKHLSYRKVVSESGGKHLVNGMDTNGSPFFPRDSNISSNLPPVPGWVTTTVTMATHAQNTPAVDSLEQKPAQQVIDSFMNEVWVETIGPEHGWIQNSFRHNFSKD